ncbi:citramalate synthase [Alkalibacter saccharofermentans]|uniref:Citramalate synthase n=1 Tax=Alkalibacter saccharofermentans DSM 14828 TaxID=1120975 RepID=A0A1M4TJ97_9FIRM|nr:citramalate synthase [Alkalibacter saccharofermentans]SHE44404.1 2-isopropylmalate synthase [Alkalibacter saccharofermentans DSM 14828]
MSRKIEIFDSTLRDGAQGSGISFSLDDKIKITLELDSLGVDYIEAGNPGSNQKDREYFEKINTMKLENSKLVAFGSTRRKNSNAAEDQNVNNLLIANTPAISIFGKSWDYHVTDVLGTTLEENLNMIADTISYMVSKEKEVIFDAEHFFDGYKNNPEYALSTLRAAVDAGARALVLCDTNGGAFPDEIYEITKKVIEEFGVDVGIHCHNDGGMAVANSIMSVEAGANQVQGTFLGIGERCGNANLSTIVPNLQIKRGYDCIPEENLQNLTTAARYIAEISNLTLDHSMPYVGNNAFAHKGGMHVDGIIKAKGSFEHIDPELVGNDRKFIMSEVSGKNTIISRIKKVDPSLTKDSPETKEILDLLKRLEHEGYQFEGAEASFDLVIRKHLGRYTPFFILDHYKIIEEEKQGEDDCTASALIKVIVKGREEMTAAEGNGPVNAIDKAIRKALEVFYENLKDFHLVDFKVRVLDGANTAAKVRVLIDSTDGQEFWSTIGVSTNIIEASVGALVDSIEYKLIKDLEQK